MTTRNKYTNLIHLWGLLWVMFSCIACSDETSENAMNPTFDREITLSFNQADLSRADLNGSDVGYDHIEKVYLYIFEGIDGTAKCISVNDIGWEKGNYKKRYTIKTALTSGLDYTLIAVGWDPASGATYGMPDGIAEQTTLTDAVVKLTAGKGKSDMARAELFAAQTQIKVSDEAGIHTSMTLTRRMAGILTYLRNVPYKVSHDGNDYVVTDVKVKLHKAQHVQLPLWKETEPSINYGTGELAGDDFYLFGWNMTDATRYTPNEAENIYTMPAQDGAVKTLPNTLFNGAFLLPMEKGSGQTLQIELYGKLADTDKRRLVKTYHITHDENKDGNPVPNFNLKENCLYSIGKKISAGTTDGDIPADLSGNILNVEISKWTEFIVDNVFGSVVGPARILSDINPDKYIFDAPGTMFKIRVKEGKANPGTVSEASNTPKWSLRIEYPTPGNRAFTETVNDWIHIATLDSEGKNIIGYTNNIDCPSGETQDLVIALNDYAVKRDLQKGIGAVPSADGYYIYDPDLVKKFEEDYREAYLVVETEGTTTPFKYRIRQYNALTVSAPTFTDRPDHFRGMARLDYGCYFDKQTGETKEGKNVLINWGYFESINWYIYGANYMDDYDGGINTSVLYRRHVDGKHTGEYYLGSAVQKLRKTEIKIEGSPLNDQGSLHWYLPAYQEMWEISNYMNSNRTTHEACSQLFQMNISANYWTSTGCRVPPTHTYSVTIGATPSQDINKDRKEKLRARPIRHFKAVK